MDRIEREITLLQAIVSTGDVAKSMRLQLHETGEALSSNAVFAGQVQYNIDHYIERAVADVTAEILASGGDLTKPSPQAHDFSRGSRAGRA